MKKMLRTIRFDETDPRVFETAAQAGEWAVSGAFVFAGQPPESVTGKTKQAFANGFLGLASFGRSTFATVGEITDTDHAALIDALAAHFVDRYDAPSFGAASAAAAEEIAFASDLCQAQPINTVFTVRRVFNADGDVKEEFRTIAPPLSERPHARVWTVETDTDESGGGHGA